MSNRNCVITPTINYNGEIIDSPLFKGLYNSLSDRDSTIEAYLKFKQSNPDVDEFTVNVNDLLGRSYNIEGEGVKSLQDQYIDKSINKVKQQISALNNKIKAVGLNVENQIKLDKFNDRLEKLISERSLVFVIDSSEDYIKGIKTELEKRKDSIYSPEEILSIRDNLGFLSKMGDYIEFDDEFADLNNKVTLLTKAADKLLRGFNTKAIETLQFYATNELNIGSDLQAILSKPLMDVGKLESEFLDYTQSSSDIIQFLGAIKDNTYNEVNKRMDDRVEELSDLVNQYLKKNKNYDGLLQRDKYGFKTGNLLNKYSAEYWSQLKEAAGGKEYWDFARKEMDFSINDNLWEKDLDEVKLLYPEWEKHGTDDYNEYQSWVLNNNPNIWLDKFNRGSITNRSAERYIVKKPKNKWLDSSYAKLKGLGEDSIELKLFNEIDKILRPINNKYGNNVNYIPEVNQSLLQYFMGSGIKGGLKQMKQEMLDAISTKLEPVVTGAKIDEVTGEPYQLIPTYMMQNTMNPSEKSYDLGKVLVTTIQQELALEQKHKIEPIMLLTKSLIEDAQIIKTSRQGEAKVDSEGNIISVSAAKSNLIDQSRFIIDEFLYNKNNRGELASSIKTTEGKVLAYDKVIDSLISYTRLKGMGLNPFSAIGNFTFGSLSNFIYGAGREEFTEGQAFKAWGTMLNSLLPGSPNAKKIKALMDFYDVEVKIEQLKNGNIPSVKATTGTNLSVYELQKRTEYYVQGQTMLAYLFNKKITDKSGRERSYYDAFDNKGKWNEAEFGENPYKDDNTKSKDILKIRDVISDIHGNYARPIKFKENWYGRALLMFRTWLPQAIQARFGAETKSITTGKVRKGRYRSYLEFGKNSEGKFDLSTLKSNLLWSVGLATSDNLSPIDKANMRKNIAELVSIAIITSMILFLKSMVAPDDDEDKQYTTYLINSLARAQSDLTFFMLPSSANQILKDPIPALKSVSDVVDILPASWNFILGQDTYKTGSRKGKSKLFKEAGDIFPVINQIDKNINYAGQVMGNR